MLRSGFLPIHEAARSGNQESVKTCLKAMLWSLNGDRELLRCTLCLLDVKWMEKGNELIKEEVGRLLPGSDKELIMYPKDVFQMMSLRSACSF